MKIKTKIFLIISAGLLFLVTSIGQAHAAISRDKSSGPVYRVDYGAIGRGIYRYVWEPTVDLALFTGANLGRTFKSFTPAVVATESYFKTIHKIGDFSKNTLGNLFNKGGIILAGIGDNLPNLTEVSRDTGNFVGFSVSILDGTGYIFKSAGNALANVPSYITEPKKNIIAIGSLFENTGKLLASLPHNMAQYPKAVAETVNTSASAIAYLDNGGQVFEFYGRIFAIIPQNLPNLKEVSISWGNLLIASGNRFNDAVAFLNDTYSNLTQTPQKQFPNTQSLISNARQNLEKNFSKINGAQAAQ